MIINPIYLIT